MPNDEDVVKGEKGVVKYFCGNCLTGVVPSAKACHRCGGSIIFHVIKDYGPETNTREISDKIARGSREYKLH